MSKNIKISNIDSNKLLNGEMNEEGIKIDGEIVNFDSNGTYDCVYALLDVDENNVAKRPDVRPNDWPLTDSDYWLECLPLNVYVRKEGTTTKVDRLVLPSDGEVYEDRIIDKAFPFSEIKQVIIKNFNTNEREEYGADDSCEILDTIYGEYYYDINTCFVDDGINNENLSENSFELERKKLMVKIPRFYAKISFYRDGNNAFKRKYEIISPKQYRKLSELDKEGFFVPKSFKDKEFLYVSAMPENSLLNQCLFGSFINYINPAYLPLTNEDKSIISDQSSTLPNSVANDLFVNDGWVMDVETWFGVILLLFKLYTGFINPKYILNSFQTYSSLEKNKENMFVSYYDSFEIGEDNINLIDKETGNLHLDWNKFVFTKGIIYSEVCGGNVSFGRGDDFVYLEIQIPKIYNNHILTNLFIASDFSIYTQQNFYIKLCNDFKPKVFRYKGYTKIGMSDELTRETSTAIFFKSSTEDEVYDTYIIKIENDVNINNEGVVHFELRPIVSTYESNGESIQINETFVKRFFRGKSIQLEVGRHDINNDPEDNDISYDYYITTKFIITALLDDNLSSNKENYHVIQEFDNTQTDMTSFLSEYNAVLDYGSEYSAIFCVGIFKSDTNDLPGNIQESYDLFVNYSNKNYQHYGQFSLLYFKNIFNVIKEEIRLNELVYDTPQDIYYSFGSAESSSVETTEHSIEIDGITRTIACYDSKEITSCQRYQKGVFLSNLNMGKFSWRYPPFGQVTDNDGALVNICVNDRAVGTIMEDTEYFCVDGKNASDGFSIIKFICDKEENLIQSKYKKDMKYYKDDKYYFEFPIGIYSGLDYENQGGMIYTNTQRVANFGSEYSNNGSICSVGSLQQYKTLNYDIIDEIEPIPNDVVSLNFYTINVTIDDHLANYPDVTYKSKVFALKNDQYLDERFLRYKEFWFEQNILLCFAGN